MILFALLRYSEGESRGEVHGAAWNSQVGICTYTVYVHS
jgi:hypothetical protein